MNRLLTLILSMLLASFAVAAAEGTDPATADSDPRLKMCATQKRQQMEEFAAKLHLDVPSEAREFFQAAEAGDWNAVSNRFERISNTTSRTETNPLMPSLNNVLFEPIYETRWSYDEFHRWNPAMLQRYADGILGSIPAGSIYFGAGRLIIPVVRDSSKSPEIFIISQNLLGISSHYRDYLSLSLGNRIWIPSEKDEQQAIQEHVNEVKNEGMMGRINLLTKAVFDHNKDKHEFYVEESFVIPWMYPYLEPHGLILKLNKEPLTQLDPAVVPRDRQFWDELTRELLADPKFLGNDWARKTYSKLRSAVAGLYAYRRLTSEAEAVFKQAQALCPDSPEANLRLAQLYMEQNRFDDAITVVEQYQNHLSPGDPSIQKISQGIEQIREMKRRAEENKPPISPPAP